MAAPNSQGKKAIRRRKWLFRLAYLIFLLVISEIAVRAYWSIKEGVPFLKPQDIRYVFFPELKHSGVLENIVNREDGYFDILVLGGSVVRYDAGIVSRLRKRLRQSTRHKVRIFNAANIGRSSLDSWLKYKQLIDKQFDLVVFYHAINETRLNNCTRATFKSDYSHSCWYKRLKRLQWHEQFMPFALPYTLEYAAIGLLYAPMFTERLDSQGVDVKTAASFRSNLSSIVDLASRKDELVLVMSFAYHIPNGPNRDEVINERGGMTVATWGSPEGVTKAIKSHNQIIREIANGAANVVYVDQESQVPKDYDHFVDPCHLAEKGCELFVQNMTPTIVAAIESPRVSGTRDAKMTRH